MKKKQLIISLIGGLIIVGLIVIISFLNFRLKLFHANYELLISIIILFCGLILTTVKIRRSDTDVFFNYGKVFLTGLYITIFVALFAGLYSFIYHKYLDPFNSNDFLFGDIPRTGIYSDQISEDQYRKTLDIFSFIKNPVTALVTTFLGYVFLGSGISLIDGLFLRQRNKKNNAS